MSAPMIARFKAWWSRPPTARDRLLAAMIGVFAGFWLGLFLPIPFDLVPRLVVGIVACMAIGVALPKAALLFFLPFALLSVGISGGS